MDLFTYAVLAVVGLALGLAVISPMLAVVIVVRVRRHQSPWWCIVLLCTSLLPVTYLAGLAGGGFTYFAPIHELCGVGPAGLASTTESLLPLSHRCVLTDGTSIELVGAWVNPALLVLVLAGCAAAWRARTLGRGSERRESSTGVTS